MNPLAAPSRYAPVVIDVPNVNGAFYSGLRRIRDGGLALETRNGPAHRMPGPMITHYRNPQQRMLLVAGRECNPFFHVFESLWMLSGSNKIDFPVEYVSKMAGYSDDGQTFNAAYGYRWRKQFGVDQVEAAITELTKNPASRRVVVQIWSAQNDLVNQKSKDLACNLLVKFSILDNLLFMDVSCRSNDMVLGGYGANAVHFSFLQEYICDRLNQNGLPVRMGAYNQISLDAHMYTEELYGKTLWEGVKRELYGGLNREHKYSEAYSEDGYEGRQLLTISALNYVAMTHDGTAVPYLEHNRRDHKTFEGELRVIVDHHAAGEALISGFMSPYLRRVVQPMLVAYKLYQEKKLDEALLRVAVIRENVYEDFGQATGASRLDVEIACSEWLERRIANRAAAPINKEA